MTQSMSTTERKRFWIWAVTFILSAALVGGIGGWAINKAYSAPAKPTTMAQSSQQCCSADVKKFARKAVKRFRAGRIHGDHGYHPGSVYKNSGVARKVWVRKIHRYLLAHPGHLKPRQVAGRTCYPASMCYASGLYGDNVSHASCVTGSYPAASSGACDRAPWHNGPGLTKGQIQKGGFVVICGTEVAVGVATAPESAGASMVAMISFPATLLCGWEFWQMVDPG